MENFFFYFVIFVFGLVAGSFLNCVIYRLHTKEGFIISRSYCPKCRHKLAWYDLIPLFSFIALKGRCRYCGQKISWQYPLVELTTGLLFILTFNQFSIFPKGNSSVFYSAGNFQFLNLIYYLIISCFLVIVFVYDLKYYIIPDRVIYPAIAIALIFNSQFLISSQFPIFKSSILSALGASAFFLAIILISRGQWMGLGDFKLAILMGLFLGFPNILVALFLSFFIGAIIGTGLIIFKRKSFRSEVPFGPFLVTGAFIALFWGQSLVNWYLSLVFP